MLIIPQTLQKRQKHGLTADNERIDDKKHRSEIIVPHTAAAVFEFQLEQPNWSPNTLLEGNCNERGSFRENTMKRTVGER